jgi:peptide/nickel transport system permease protein
MPTLAFEAFQAVFLITDLLLFALVLSAVGFVVYGRQREHYQRAWVHFRSRRLPMICGGLVMLYCLVGLLDSVHYQLRAQVEGVAQVAEDGQAVYEPEVLSLIDLACSELRQRTEKTFSAPFAAYQFTKETTTDADGITSRDFPRLEFGGSHLEAPQTRIHDIILLGGRGVGFGLLAAIAIVCMSVGFSAWRSSRSAKADWRAGVGSGLGIGLFLGVVTIGTFCVAYLSSRYHIFGTDQVGHDVFYRALKGCRVGLVLGTMTTLIATPLAIIFGMAAGYLGGRIDDAVQYLYTTLSSIPEILLIAAAMLIVSTSAAVGGLTIYAADERLVWLCAIMGIGGWTGLCRLIRAETLKVRELEYIQAADALGVSAVKIMARHILPNVTHIVLISMLLRFSGLVLTEAVLAYANIGVHPAMDSWGKMINGARLDISRDPVVWWNLLAAFVFMFGLVLPANIFGDAVRDALDPRLKFEGAEGASS